MGAEEIHGRELTEVDTDPAVTSPDPDLVAPSLAAQTRHGLYNMQVGILFSGIPYGVPNGRHHGYSAFSFTQKMHRPRMCIPATFASIRLSRRDGTAWSVMTLTHAMIAGGSTLTTRWSAMMSLIDHFAPWLPTNPNACRWKCDF